MPLTLYRYILFEVLKLLAASTLVLVVVMSFGVAIKPISEGLLEPIQMVKVILYTMPGMLTFALPFAAAFASTLVFFRMCGDNEITACAVSGISYREILAPIFVLGLVLTLSMFFLSNWIVPKFWQLAAREVEQDVARMLIRQIQRGEVVRMDDWIIYADYAQDGIDIDPTTTDDKPVPQNRMLLLGAAVGKTQSERRPILNSEGEPKKNKEGKVITEYHTRLRADYTAERVWVDLFYDDLNDRAYATLSLNQVAMNNPESGRLISLKHAPIKEQEVPSPFRQRPKYMSLTRLRNMAREPDMSPEIRYHKQVLVDALASRQLLIRLEKQFQQQNVVGNLTDHADRTVQIRAETVRLLHDRITLGTSKQTLRRGSEYGGRGIEVVTTIDQAPKRIFARTAEISVDRHALDDEPRLRLTLFDTVVAGSGPTDQTAQRELQLPLLKYAQPIAQPLIERGAEELSEVASTFSRGAPEVHRHWKMLDHRIRDLRRHITSRLHERAAMAVMCLLVLLLGGIMSMLLRNQMPLAIFFWCFMPTVLAFVTVSSGQQMFESHDISSVLSTSMIWSGNGGLAVIIIGIYAKLRRN